MKCRNKQRKRLDARYAAHGKLDDPCVYCGVAADTMDHIPPLHYVERVSQTEIELHSLRLMPACNECNGVLTGHIIPTLRERRRHLKEHYRRKYKKFLAMPRWGEDELAELDDRLADDFRRAQRFADWLKRRMDYWA